jgi:hypothetical protein
MISEIESVAETGSSSWNWLYRVGGAAALIAGVIFRRNISAEITLFGAHGPGSVIDWFALLQNNRLLGFAFLNFFDVVDYALVGLMFLALYAVLRQVSKGALAIALACGIVGIAVYFASNTAFSMLSLSSQYAAATTGAQRSMLLAAGQAMLAINQGTGIYLSLLLQAVAGLMFSVIMLRSGIFNRATAYLGILASAFDLAYCFTVAFVPSIDNDLIAICTLPAAGLLLMIWHILIGLRLLKIVRLEKKRFPNNGKRR